MSDQTPSTGPESARIDTPESSPPASPAGRPPFLLRVLRVVVGSLLPLIVIAAAAYGAKRLIDSKEKMPERPRESAATLVSVETVQPTNTRVSVQAMGTVMAARETVLMPQVTGRIDKLSPDFMIGGQFSAGEEILRIEKQDYLLALEQRKSDLARAEYEVQVEEGYQVIARSELDVTGVRVESEASRSLLLREPHLKRVKAAMLAAGAMVTDAELDLARTVVHAPFNAVVVTKEVDLGTVASPQTRLCTLVGTDEYWVKVSLPVERLAWIRLPRRAGEEGSTTHVRQAGLTAADARSGHVVRALAEVETTGRMANVLVSVKDPLGLSATGDKRPPLLIGAFVHVVIEGRRLDGVFSLPRHAVREGNSVWVMDMDNTLDIREVKIAWRDRDRVLITDGLRAGEHIVIGNIATPVQGMRLRTRDEGPTAPAAEASAAQPTETPAAETPAADGRAR